MGQYRITKGGDERGRTTGKKANLPSEISRGTRTKEVRNVGINTRRRGGRKPACPPKRNGKNKNGGKGIKTHNNTEQKLRMGHRVRKARDLKPVEKGEFTSKNKPGIGG